ncbi:uncharacterized protein LOC120696098 [Panicum virgatum]|uniref:Uncharacterized protein n=1 Tax=Panicum virgatum TaxID=38727 RepID=A0A8T0WDT5_PANVG|nr:uncharacterized protein LOC120696098 [Panicum virgatum]KAG2644026.1 hypothetical protein PVAP13_2KG399800 [Panicum virgatum]
MMPSSCSRKRNHPHTPVQSLASEAGRSMDDAQQLLEELPTRVAATSFWIPRLGMTFSSLDEAWEFWVTYGGRMGFDVRKSYTNTSNLDGLVTSKFKCCSRC